MYIHTYACSNACMPSCTNSPLARPIPAFRPRPVGPEVPEARVVPAADRCVCVCVCVCV